MAASGKSSISAAGAWGRAHPRTAAVAIAVLSFLLGAGAGGSGEAALRGDLAAARARADSVRTNADAEVDDLSAEVSSLESRISRLSADNRDLENQVTRMNAQRELPEVVGTREVDALDLQELYGWTARIVRRYSTERPGTVLAQRPAPGTMMRYGAPYTLVVAKPLPKIERVVGMWRAQAERALARWNVVVVEQVSGQRPGKVIAMSPTGGSGLLPGATVTLTIAKKAPPPPPEPEIESFSGAGCTPGYSPCLPPASDYDCSGGSGDGPEYTGYVTVTGSDPYGLDSDGDGAGCES